MDVKRVLCYGDSNTWGYDGETGLRFPADIRWPGVVAKKLGPGFELVEAGLNGRTAVFEDPLTEGLCGISHLYPAMGCAAPLDGMIVMLGTNDCKQRFSATADNIVRGIGRLLVKAQRSDYWKAVPRILLMAPVCIDLRYQQSAVADTLGIGCAEKSAAIVPLIAACAREHGCEYLDVNTLGAVNQTDFLHLDAPSHAALAIKVREAFSVFKEL